MLPRSSSWTIFSRRSKQKVKYKYNCYLSMTLTTDDGANFRNSTNLRCKIRVPLYGDGGLSPITGPMVPLCHQIWLGFMISRFPWICQKTTKFKYKYLWVWVLTHLWFYVFPKTRNISMLMLKLRSPHSKHQCEYLEF